MESVEKRKDKRHPFVATVKLGYDLDDLELCRSINCDGGRALVPDGESAIDNCPECEGRGFLPKCSTPSQS